MKVYSLYHHNKFVASFATREESVAYGKECGGDAWDYDIREEYLYKTQQLSHIPLTTPSQPIPYTHPPVISKPPARYPDILDTGITLMPGTPQINNSMRAE